jgi:hypothetical protein
VRWQGGGLDFQLASIFRDLDGRPLFVCERSGGVVARGWPPRLPRFPMP